MLPISDEPNRHQNNGNRAVVLAGDPESGPILAHEHTNQDTASQPLIAGLAVAGLHVYVGRMPAGGYCAVWEYHPPGEATTPLRDRCCDRDRPPNPAEGSRDLDEATECELSRWTRLMLGSPAGVPAMVLLAAH